MNSSSDDDSGEDRVRSRPRFDTAPEEFETLVDDVLPASSSSSPQPQPSPGFDTDFVSLIVINAQRGNTKNVVELIESVTPKGTLPARTLISNALYGAWRGVFYDDREHVQEAARSVIFSLRVRWPQVLGFEQVIDLLVGYAQEESPSLMMSFLIKTLFSCTTDNMVRLLARTLTPDPAQPDIFKSRVLCLTSFKYFLKKLPLSSFTPEVYWRLARLQPQGDSFLYRAALSELNSKVHDASAEKAGHPKKSGNRFGMGL